MSAKQPQSTAELEQHLREQVGFLIASAAAFDRGFHAEAKRLATTIRVLVHDTRASHSLLTQLSRKTAPFWDSAMELQQGAASSQFSLVGQYLSQSVGAGFFAFLDDLPSAGHFADFTVWWETPVLRDQAHNPISRKQLVLWVANQDGGAHVDPGLDSVYSDLSRNNSLGWVQHWERDGTTDTAPIPAPNSLRFVRSPTRS